MNILYFRKKVTGKRSVDERLSDVLKGPPNTPADEYIVITEDTDPDEHCIHGFELHDTFDLEPHEHEHRLPTDRTLWPR